jgi:hypothetical protein
MMPPRRARRFVLATALLALAAAVSVLSACGGGDSGGVAAINDGGAASATTSNSTAPADREEALLKAAQCMRDHGVKSYPDPVVDANGNVRPGDFRAQLNRNDPTVRKAFTACRSLFEATRPQFTPDQQQKLQDALLKFAKCVRAHGYDMPDPTFGSPPGQGRGPFGGVNPNDPAFAKAREACQSLLAGAFPGGGPGGPGGGT